MYDQIQRNNRDSLILMGVCALLLGLVGWAIATQEGMPPEAGVGIAAVVAVVVGLFSFYGGGGALLAVSGATRVRKAQEPQLFNVVEEMAIAAGLPMPAVYIIEDTAPNAFATGRDPHHAAVAVTRGLLTKLNRDELQGVIAHEMSHVRNYDIRFAMLMAIMVGSIALISDFAWRSQRGRRRSSSSSGGGQAQLVLLILAVVLLILAPIAARLIELAMSRKREYLADASAALLTRYPAGLASALQKISADPEPLEAANRATQHLYIANPVHAGEKWAESLTSTHPPIGERVKRLQAMAHATGMRETAPGRPAASTAALQAPGLAAAAPAAGMAALTAGSAGVPPSAAPPSVPRPASPSPFPAAAPSVEAGTCPRCQDRLWATRVGSRHARCCRHCGGVWIDQDSLQHLLAANPDRLVAIDRSFPNLIGHGWQEVAAKSCPACSQPLQERQVQDLEEVTVDVCAACHGVWFDDGEMDALATKARRQAQRA